MLAFGVCCLGYSFVLAQETWLTGRLIDGETGAALPFANVYLVGHRQGTTANQAGQYQLALPATDSILVRYSYVSYAAKETLLVAEGGVVTIDVALYPQPTRVQGISVLGEQRFFDKSSFPASIIVRSSDLRAIPAPGDGDLLRSLQKLPGITSQTELSSSLYIRGNTPDQTRIQLDGATVYNPSHVFGFFSMFNGDMVEAAKVLKGGFPADYGQSIGSILDIRSVGGNRHHTTGNLSLGVVSSSALVQGPVGNGSWVLSARRSYQDLLRSLFGFSDLLPDYYFYDSHVRVTQDLGENGNLGITLLRSVDDLRYEKLKNSGVIDEAIYSKWSNSLASLEISHLVSNTLLGGIQVSFSGYSGSLDATQNVLLLSYPGGGRLVNYGNALKDFSVRGGLEYSLGWKHTISAGLFLTHYDASYSNNAGFGFAQYRFSNKYSVFGGFVQDQIRLTESVSLTPGIRLTKAPSGLGVHLEPRLVATAQIGPELFLRAGGGIYRQWLNGGQPASYLTFSGIDFWFPLEEEAGAPLSKQVSADILSRLFPWLTATISGYYSHLSNVALLRFDREDSQSPFHYGNGTNYGLEGLVEMASASLRAMVGYTLAWTRREFADVDNGSAFPARHDRRHSLDFSIDYSLSETWQIAAAWTFSTGQAYTGILGYYEIRGLVDGLSGNHLHYILSNRNAFRLPSYHRLDVGIYRKVRFDSWDLTLRLDVFNVYNRKNALGATNGFSDDPYYRFLPIIPTITAKAEF